jgi:hypothetical protein
MSPDTGNPSSEKEPPLGDKSDSLQPADLICDGCNEKILGAYFKISGKTLCVSCKERAESAPKKGLKRGRPFQISLAGLVIIGLIVLGFFIFGINTKTGPVVIPATSPTLDLSATPFATSQTDTPTADSNESPTETTVPTEETLQIIPPNPFPTETPSPSITQIPSSETAANNLNSSSTGVFSTPIPSLTPDPKMISSEGLALTFIPTPSPQPSIANQPTAPPPAQTPIYPAK